MDSIGCKREAEKVLGARMKGKDITSGGSPSTSRHHSPSNSSSEVTHASTSQSPPVKFVGEDQHQSRTPEHLEVSIESLLGHLELKEKLPIRMFSFVGAIFKQATRHEGNVDPGGINEWQAVLEGADTSYRRGRIDVGALQVIRSILDYLWLNGPEDDLVKASRALADACRERELRICGRDRLGKLLTIHKARWRVPFREGGILDFFLEVIATEDVSTDLNLEALRLIGNACADEGLYTRLLKCFGSTTHI